MTREEEKFLPNEDSHFDEIRVREKRVEARRVALGGKKDICRCHWRRERTRRFSQLSMPMIEQREEEERKTHLSRQNK